jgi:hypothetical protein
MHEIKWDGYRVQAHLWEGKATIYTRNGNDWTRQFAPIAALVTQLKARSGYYRPPCRIPMLALCWWPAWPIWPPIRAAQRESRDRGHVQQSGK